MVVKNKILLINIVKSNVKVSAKISKETIEIIFTLDVPYNAIDLGYFIHDHKYKLEDTMNFITEEIVCSNYICKHSMENVNYFHHRTYYYKSFLFKNDGSILLSKSNLFK